MEYTVTAAFLLAVVAGSFAAVIVDRLLRPFGITGHQTTARCNGERSLPFLLARPIHGLAPGSRTGGSLRSMSARDGSSQGGSLSDAPS
jgi:hypothetical protein